MRHHRIQQFVFAYLWIAKSQLVKRRPLFAQELAHGNAHPCDQLLEQCARRRRLQIFDDMRLDAGVADHGKRVAGPSAIGIVVDDHVHGETRG